MRRRLFRFSLMKNREVSAGNGKSRSLKDIEIPGLLTQPPLETFQFSCCVHPIEEQLRNLDRLRVTIWNYGAGHSAAYEVYLGISKILQHIAIPGLVQYPSEWLSLVSSLSYEPSLGAERVVARIMAEQDSGFVQRLSWYFFQCSSDPWKGGESWGELNLAKNPSCLEQALLLMQLDSFQEALWNTLVDRVNALSDKERSLLFRAVYVAAGRPETTDLSWGEHHLFDERNRLVRALHCIGKLGLGIHTAEYYAEWEHGLEEPSAILEIAGKRPNRGQIGLVVGPGDSRDVGFQKVLHFQESCLEGCQVSYLFVGSQGDRDHIGPLYSQNGVLLPAGKLLLHKWAEFFAAEPYAKYLQICVGSGAFEVQAALQALPEYLRQRLLVIAIEPNYLISKGMCFQVVNILPEERASDTSASGCVATENNSDTRSLVCGRPSELLEVEGICPEVYLPTVRQLVESYLWLNSLRLNSSFTA